ncbi:hypothetical protein [Pseudoxanthobacter sp.]|uniref:hypothetical protein n=1 Tax=Pseudoxanthobacter sp. TaxID=1925742 RepID=UPI002FE31A63
MANLVPVDYDPFASGAQPAAPAPKLVPVDHDPFAEAVSPAGDIAQSFGSGLARGAAETVMAPATGAQMLKDGVYGVTDWVENKLRGMLGAEPLSEADIARRNALRDEIDARTDPIGRVVSSAQEAVRGWMTRNLHAPQTTAGEYARTIGEFAPAALSPGSLVRRAATVMVPAVASETAGQMTKGTPFETAARVGGAVVGGIGTALAGARSAPQQIVRKGASGLDSATVQADWTAAKSLMADAEQRGLSLTPVEALNQVSGGRYRNLAKAQRVAESTGGGAQVMDDFMAARPAQVEASGRAAIDALAPRTMDPVQTGTRAQAAAEGAIQDLRGDINAGTRAAYRAAEADPIPAVDFDRIAANPGYQETLRQIRSHPVLGPAFQHLPDNSVGMIDAVTKEMKTKGAAAANSANAGHSGLLSSLYSEGAQDARSSASRTSAPYAQALAEQAARRQGELAPLEAGPVGQIAGTADVTAQRGALFPRNPEAGSSPVVGSAVKQLAARDPDAALGLVRQHAETVFNDATKSLQSGPNQFGGAKFSATLRANPEARDSLRAAVEALPDGKSRWDGFNRYLDILEATGKRLQRGSETAFNGEDIAGMKGGGTIGRAVSSAGTQIPRILSEAYDRYRFGRNTSELANILTSRGALPLFENLLKSAPNAVRSRQIAALLATIGLESRMAGTQPVTEPAKMHP